MKVALRRVGWGLGLGMTFAGPVAAGGPHPTPPEWVEIPEAPAGVLALPPVARPVSGRALWLDLPAMSQVLSRAPLSRPDEHTGRIVGGTVADSPAIIALPTPDGGIERFRFVESPVLPDDLRAKYPDIRTYIGQGVDNPGSTAHFDLTPLGFHAQVFTPTPRGLRGTETDWAGAWYIDPLSRGDIAHYAVYRHGDLPAAGAMVCRTVDDLARQVLPHTPLTQRGPTGPVPLHVVRIAVAATGEYTAYHSPPGLSNQAAGIAAVATSVLRVNQVFMRDLAVQLVLAANNDAIIYADAGSDPFLSLPPANPLSVPELGDILAQTPGVINANIAAGAWDIGHTVHATPTGAGFEGRADIGGVCGPNAANAASTSGLPNGTYFWISLLAHEIGHQLGGTHSFNGINGTCGNAGQYTAASAIEPGSGTTIMSYAGNCRTDNANDDNIVTHTPTLPPGSPPDPNFLPTSGALPMLNAYNIDQINQWLAAHFCGFNVDTGNRRPFAPTVGGPWTIPANTPFRINAADTSDPDAGQSTSISWEQFNLGAQRALGADTGVNEPLFRTFNPSADPDRNIPVLATVLGSPALRGENLPRFARSIFFRAVCRDNFAQGGGVTQSQITVNVWRTPGDAAFQVTAPAAGAQFCGAQILAVQWNPVGTADAPVNASTVDISLSLDGGQTFPIGLLAGVPNSGQALVAVPAVNTALARVKVEATDNIFFNISPGNFSIAAGPPSITTQPADVAVCPGQPATLSLAQGFNPGVIQWFKDGSAIPNANATSLAFTPANTSNSGDYHATITNGCGQVTTRTARLQVGVSRDSLTPMPPSPVAACSTVTARIQARGVGPLSYRWFRNGAALNDGDGLSGTQTAALTLTGARYAHEGFYEVTVTDSCVTNRYIAEELRVDGPFWVQKGLTPAPGGFGQASAGWIMVFDEFRNVAFMYGGTTNSGGQTNSVWEYDGASWTVRHDGSALPSPQQFAGQELFDGFVPPSAYSAAYSPDHRAIFLVGGAGDLYPLRIWRWDGATYTTVGNRPGSGNGFTLLQAAYDRARQRLVIVRVSGSGGPAEVLDFNPTTGEFVAGPTTPQANGVLLFESRMWYDQARQAVILHQPAGNFNPAAMYAYNGAWSTLNGVPFPMGRFNPFAYDTVRRHGVTVTGLEIGPACGQWYTGTFTFPGTLARFGSVLPQATEWNIPLPDGPPRNPAGAGQSPDNAFSARMLAFDPRRRVMLAVGGRGMSSVACGQSTWDAWERRYLDAAVFEVQPPAAPVPVGQTLTLTATPAGAPALALRWRRNNIVLSDGPVQDFPGTTVSGATTATLTINGPGAAVAAAYRLQASNGCGLVLSSTAVVGTLPSGDFNQDGSVSVQDIFDFLAAYFGGGPNADFNGSGTVTVQDIFDFLAAYFGG